MRGKIIDSSTKRIGTIRKLDLTVKLKGEVSRATLPTHIDALIDLLLAPLTQLVNDPILMYLNNVHPTHNKQHTSAF